MTDWTEETKIENEKNGFESLFSDHWNDEIKIENDSDSGFILNKW